MADTKPDGAPRASISFRGRALSQLAAAVDALDSIDAAVRKPAFAALADALAGGSVPRPEETGWSNILARTFFSYAADGASPSRRVWDAAVRGLSVVGSCDTDNLGALTEMLAAGRVLGVRATASLETKCHAPQFADREIGYPGQCGFLRALGLGFTAVPPLDTPHGLFIAGLPDHAHARNRARIEKINPLLSPVCITYDEDVLPLTPAGNPTPEHLALAYVRKAEARFPGKEEQAVFWSDVLGGSPSDAEALLSDISSFSAAVWEKFRQFTAEERDPANYPSVADFFKAVALSGGIPCVFWRDGTTAGESDSGALLDAAVGWGARAAAVAPDFLCDEPDAEHKRVRLDNFANFIAAARVRGLPVVGGSFVDRAGQRVVPAFDAPELGRYFGDFRDAALWVHGQAK